MGKQRGANAGRKLKKKRSKNKSSNSRRTKAATNRQRQSSNGAVCRKSDPFGGASHATGIVVARLGIEARQPNSGVRKCVRVQLLKTGREVTAFVPFDGGLNYIYESDEVVLSGRGRSGRSVGDLSGVKYNVVKVGRYSLKRYVDRKIPRIP